jgi:tellurite resistance protein
MYQQFITTTDNAVCHLFIHCCFRDDAFVEAEVDEVAEKFVALDMHKNLNFKEEVRNYKSYKASITDEKEYLQYLINRIKPANEAALYSYCLELGVSDSTLDPMEKKLFETLGQLLGLTIEEQSIIQKLMVQREVVKTNKFF